MANELAIDITQTEDNQLSKIAERERAKLIPKNDYKAVADEYSATNPDALADGDSKGRGTGVFLDVYNQEIGTREDVLERRAEIRVNKYNDNRTYPDFQI
jgi:hypothetical protein